MESLRTATLLLLLAAAACSVPDLDVLGRRCGADASCGPGARCDTRRQVCVAAAAVTDSAVTDGAATCAAGQLRCDGRCVDPASDNAHCGGCARPCGAGLDCQARTCVCKPGGGCPCCCNAGSCVSLSGQSTKQCGRGGAACASCEDSLGCTNDSCSAGSCQNAIVAGSCRIQGVCQASKALNPDNRCQRCDPAASAQGWTDFFGAGCVGTIAGSGQVGFTDGPVAAARFDEPVGLAVDAAGAVYVADRKNHAVRKIAGGQVTTLAGGAAFGYKDGPAASARFHGPSDVALDAAGKVYVADQDNHVIRVIHKGSVSTLAGSGVKGFKDGPLASALFAHPESLVIDSQGTIYLTDSSNRRVRKIAGGQVSTLAGDGTKGNLDGPALSARFSALEGIALGPKESAVYLTDQQNHNIRKIEAGLVTTVAGFAGKIYKDGPVATAGFNFISGIDVDKSGVIYVAEVYDRVIRKVSGGVVSTAAGVGSSGYLDGEALKAAFTGTRGLVIDAAGVIYISDGVGHYIRKYLP